MQFRRLEGLYGWKEDGRFEWRFIWLYANIPGLL